MAALTYLLWLTTREGLRPETAAALVRRFGTAEAAYFADPGEYELLSLSERLCRSLADKSLERAERILGDCDRLGVTLLTYQDAAYPERLLQLHDFPLVLYVKGRLFRFDEELAVAIVGARECTPYGVAMAGRLGLELARSGALVLSGLAQGIDAAALKGALQGGGPAVSVLAGGVDVVYPRRNQGLYEDVAAAGAILSENPPGTPPEGWRFPIRNRILSGLSAGVAAVEAAEHSRHADHRPAGPGPEPGGIRRPRPGGRAHERGHQRPDRPGRGQADPLGPGYSGGICDTLSP